jgi:putative restriction endonuclease
MNFWWVNHSQTFKVEIDEECIWSPKTNNDGRRNQSYDNLKEASVGDVIFSYADGEIKAIGVVVKNALETPRPPAFKKAGNQWANTGWRLFVKWKLIDEPISPKKYISRISPLLPDKYSPIQKNGNGNQGIYLARIDERLGKLLIDMIDIGDIGARSVIHDLQDAVKDEEQARNIGNSQESTTVKAQLIDARVGQGLFRNEVEKIENRCRVTGLRNKSFLIASHIKPWRSSTNAERLDGHNGFLLSPHVDKLFDKGYISFNDNGKILLANSKELLPILNIWSLDPHSNVGSFSKKQKDFLCYHRDEIHKRKIEDLRRKAIRF